MPTQSFAQNISVSGSGFDQKITALVGIGNAVRQSQTARQQMQDQFSQQKELIQFRGETQLENQIEFDRRVTQPREQRQVKAQAEQQYMQNVMKSHESAQERRRNLLQEFHKDYGPLRKYNLFTPYFDVRENPESGMYEAKIYSMTQDGPVEMDEQDYRWQVEQATEQAQWFEKLEEGLKKGWFPEEFEQGKETRVVDGQKVERFTRSKASDILRTAQEDPQMARVFLRDANTRFEFPSPYQDEDMEGSGTPAGRGANAQFNTATSLANIRGFADESGIVEFNYAENPSMFRKLGQAVGLSTPTEVRNKSVNLNGLHSIEEVMQQVNDTSKDLFDLDLSPLSRIDDATRSKILAGDDEGLSGDHRDLARKINRMRDEGELVDKQLDQLFSLYYNLPAVADEWRRKFAPHQQADVPNQHIYPNFGRNTQFGDLFTLPNQDVTATKVYGNELMFR